MKGYRSKIWQHLASRPVALFALALFSLFCIVGIWAPFFASSRPIVVSYQGSLFFPLFRYLFVPSFYTKRIDLFFNLCMFTVPLAFLFSLLRQFRFAAATVLLHLLLFFLLLFFPMTDPASNATLLRARQQALAKLHAAQKPLTWDFELDYLSPYAKLNLLLNAQRDRLQHERILLALPPGSPPPPTLWQLRQENQARLAKSRTLSPASLAYQTDRRRWIEEESQKIGFELMPLLSQFHWEEDAGGSQHLNQQIYWTGLTRTNRKDLTAALIFGVRISLVIGVLAVALSLAIGIPVGAAAGYFGGKLDLFACRFIEIWESMPVFFMLLLVISMLQSKSIFLIISVIGLFGWTGFSRYIRAEFFKQRNLPYVEACRALGYPNRRIIFSHVLPNALPPVLTLLPFAMMAAITSEAGLSFLGLGEESSCSWGVLMDEGRRVFPSESYLLWPPALLLTLLLVSIALVGDALRDALDPKMQR